MTTNKIMLVDDEEFVLTCLKRSLRREGYELVTFTEAEQALEYLETNRVDVIVSDHRMPSMSGIDFLIKTRKKHPDVVRILLTGYADMDVAIRAVNEGKLFRFLTKPWNDAELKAALVNAMHLRELSTRNRDVINQLKKQDDHIRSLETMHPGIGKVERDARGAIIIEEG
jgi:two-component system, probable response regulator PhcQ